MEVIGQPGKITTNDREQRWGSWFIDKASKRISIDHWYDGTRSDTPNHNVDEWRKHIQQLSFHTGDFERAYGKLYEIVGQQGAGDLTMNDWNVAFVKSWQTSDNPELTRHVPDLLFLLEEPLWRRSYTCLTKRRGNKVSIEEGVRFSHVPDFRIFIGDSDITDEVELAISGRQVIRDGEVVDFIDIVDQFNDIRHLVMLPNLNPKDALTLEPEKQADYEKIKTFETYPRVFFGEPKDYDVWLGEGQLLADRNLRRAALKIPIHLNILYEGLGAPRELVKAVMKREGYKEFDHVKNPGEWRFLPKNYARPGDWIEVFLKANGFPCTMIGVREDTQSVYLLAFNHGYGNTPAKSISQVAEIFLKYTGVQKALLFDEGGDVFQKADLHDGNGLQPLVPVRREQIRCCFIIGKKVNSGGS